MSTYHKISGTMARILGDSVASTDVDDMQDEVATAKKFKDNMRIYKYCYDKDTEVMTSTGWKFFKDVLDSDKIFSLNPDTRMPEFVKFKHRIEYKYTGDMVKFYGAKEDILVTPNHKMYAKPNVYGDYRLISAEELASKNFFGFCRHSGWEGVDRENININGVSVNFKDFCEFMGFYLSEGCLRRSNGIKIGQARGKHPKIYQNIVECLARIFKDKKICTYPTSVEVYGIKWMHDYLAAFGKVFDKFIPEEIKNSTKENISIFIEAFLLGDGRIHRVPSQYKKDKHHLQRIYYTSAPKLAADLGELIIKLGKFPSYTQIKSHKTPHWAVRETLSKNSYFYSKRVNKKSMKISQVPYDDQVYCLELEKNHVMLTRRHGRCTWQGNCLWEILEPCKDYHCSTCPLAHMCPGTHMKDAVGYYKISDFVQKMNLMSKYTLDAEWLCRKPSRSGLILEGYRDDVNTLDMSYIEGLPIELAIDFGFTKENPYAVLAIQKLENYKFASGRTITGYVVVDEIYTVPKTNAEIIAKVKARRWYNPDKPIFGIADSAEKDLIAEWNQSGFRIQKVNKKAYTISAGLDKLNGMIKPLVGLPTLYVARRCKGFLTEKDSYKWGPKGEPMDKDNHCVTGDSLIETLRGQIPIKDVIVGDMVLTRGGYRKVLASGCTGINDVWEWNIAGQKIKATDYHPIYTVNRGFVPVKDLTDFDIVLVKNTDGELVWRLNFKNLTEKLTEDTQSQTKDPLGFISRIILCCSTGLFGCITKGVFLGLTIYTILTVILATIKLKTWRACLEKTISHFMGKILQKNSRNGKEGILSRSETQQKNGTDQKKDTNGTQSMEKKCLDLIKTLLNNVLSVEETIQRNKQRRAGQNFAQATAELQPEETVKPTILRQSVLFAVKLIEGINTEKEVLVPVNAAKYLGKQKVYNLQVEEYPEFICHKLLVHNSIDAARYYFVSRKSSKWGEAKIV
jgi:hypothetical protein